jgi:ABC-type branched-subunit amino acid transport system substrate-binding protein
LPEGDDLIRSVSPIVESSGTPSILPGLTAFDATLSAAGLWFRIGLSADGMACAMAQEMYGRGFRNVVILYQEDVSNAAFASAMAATFAQFDPFGEGPATATLVGFGGASSGSPTAAAKLKPDAVVLAASPSSGAVIVQEWSSVSQQTNWFLGPNLLNNVFLANVPPGVMEGATTIAASLHPNEAEAERLDAAFLGRFSDVPFMESYFYYDAFALTLLAIEAAHREAGGSATRDGVRTALPEVARSPGEVTAWDQVPEALARIRSGADVDYAGLSGPLTLENGGIDPFNQNYEFQSLVGTDVVVGSLGICFQFGL